MEDDSGIELSLGLSCGGSAGKSKSRDGSSSDIKTEEGDANSNNLGDLKSFFDTSIEKADSSSASQGTQTTKENFFTNLANSAPVADAAISMHGVNGPQFPRYGEHSTNKLAEVKFDTHENGEKMWVETGNKRKLLFEESGRQKVHDKDSVKTSHISVTTEDGSTADNGDVEESEVEGSTSRRVFDIQGQKQSNLPPRNESKLGNLNFGTPLPLMGIPYSLSMNVQNVTGESKLSMLPLSSMTQLMPSSNGDGPGNHSMNPGNMALTFGYAPVHLPILDKDHSQGLVSHSQQFPPSGAAVTQAPHSSSVALRGTSSSSLPESEIKGNNTIYKPKELEGYPPEISAIKPGVDPGLKFGGCGSYPDLPWVSTTGPGPNGRTISGVTYKYDKNQIRIVCACHGSNMSPEEFVQHAVSSQHNTENSAGLASFQSSNPAASTQS
ncbi:hypothetical protein GIB67_025306 [Kingdonia uniflora]|uniref:Ninja-family protein n=1 Tax=Kingdonia uniflora TaxID=39325 RepID=A0A7J7NBT6_9MAGN|nr:hypothetical protein GIB67_025306 [Kingdonia uniflora]